MEWKTVISNVSILDDGFEESQNFVSDQQMSFFVPL